MLDRASEIPYKMKNRKLRELLITSYTYRFLEKPDERAFDKVELRKLISNYARIYFLSRRLSDFMIISTFLWL